MKGIKLVLFKTEMCEPCQEMMPMVEDIATSYNYEYKFIEINEKEGSKIAERYGVKSTPTLFILKDNVIMGVKKGYAMKEPYHKNYDELEKQIKESEGE